MTTVTVSTKYQVVIPESVRKSLGVRPGEKFQVMHYDGRVQLIPLRRMRDMKGVLRGMNTSLAREGDRVCMRAFQNAVGCVDLARNALLWTRNTGGVNAVGSHAHAMAQSQQGARQSGYGAFTPSQYNPNLTIVFDGTTAELSGSQLMHDGIPVRLPAMADSELLLFEPLE